MPSGRWFRAKAFAQEGATCAIDAASSAMRVNQTKLRRGRHAWDAVAVPPTSLAAPASASAPRARRFVRGARSFFDLQ